MIITSIEELEKFKRKIIIDETNNFIMYQKEVDRFGLQEGMEITEEKLEKMMLDTVYRRAKQKALSILKFMDRTELELSNKLTDAGYSQDIIERTIAYVTEYGYLNNERFTCSYIRSRMNTKSRLAIRTELLQKGIEREVIDRIMEEEYTSGVNVEQDEDAELTAIKKAVARKLRGAQEDLTPEDKKKIMAALYRKGFDLSKIKQVVK